MNRKFVKGERVRHARFGKGKVVSYLERDVALVLFDSLGHRSVSHRNLLPIGPSWSEVRPGDTAEFTVQGDTLKIKARGEEGQPTVLGWKVTELDGVWDLLSIKKRNPPVPTHFGARVMYRDKQWSLVYSAMIPNLGSTKHNMVWVEINENHFNWVGHEDIDREHFEVIFDGWQNL